MRYKMLYLLSAIALGMFIFLQATADASPKASASSPMAAPHGLAASFAAPEGRQSLDQPPATILLYHYIEDLSSVGNTDGLRRDFITTAEAFESQIRYLHDNAYQSIDLYRLHNAMTKGEPLPPRSIVITFDDGDSSVYARAFPLMRQYGFTGTIFMITQFTDENRPGYLTWEQAMEMARAGWRLEAHTKSHPSLRGNSRDYQRDQIGGSVQTLAKQLGYMPRFFAYPYGEYDDTSIAVAREVGLWGALTTKPGEASGLLSLYELPRLEIFRSTNQQAFIRRLTAPRRHVL